MIVEIAVVELRRDFPDELFRGDEVGGEVVRVEARSLDHDFHAVGVAVQRLRLAPVVEERVRRLEPGLDGDSVRHSAGLSREPSPRA